MRCAAIHFAYRASPPHIHGHRRALRVIGSARPNRWSCHPSSPAALTFPCAIFARLGEGSAQAKAPKRLTPRADGTRRLYLASGEGLWTMVAEIRHTEGCHGDEGSECALMLPRNEAPFICLFPYRKAWA